MISSARRHLPLLAGAGVYLLLYAVAALRYDGLLAPGVFVHFLEDNAAWGILAVGMTFVILSGGIDLSVGAVMSLSSLIVGVLVMDARWPLGAAMPAAVALCTLLGLAMGCLIHFTGLKPVIVTLAGLFFARGLGFIIRLESFQIDDPALAALSAWGLDLAAVRVHLTAIAFVAAVLIGWYVAVLTPFGRRVYALGGSEESALLMGLKVGATRVGVYALSGFCGGLAGLVLVLYMPSVNLLDSVGVELDVIAAVVVGGTLLSGGVGSVVGTFIGVLTLALIYQVITTYEGHLGSGATRVAVGLLLLAFVLLQRLILRIRQGIPGAG